MPCSRVRPTRGCLLQISQSNTFRSYQETILCRARALCCPFWNNGTEGQEDGSDRVDSATALILSQLLSRGFKSQRELGYRNEFGRAIFNSLLENCGEGALPRRLRGVCPSDESRSGASLASVARPAHLTDKIVSNPLMQRVLSTDDTSSISGFRPKGSERHTYDDISEIWIPRGNLSGQPLTLIYHIVAG